MQKKTQISILYLIPYFYPAVNFGGPVSALSSLAKELSKKNFKVTILTTNIADKGGTMNERVNFYNGSKIIYSKVLLPKFSYSTRLFLSIDQFFTGLRLIPSFDIVHFHDFFIPQYFLMAIYCKFIGKPFFITPHGSLAFYRQRGKVLLKRVFYALFAGFLANNASAIIAVSEHEKRTINNILPAKRVLCLPNIVIPQHKLESINVRKHYGIPKNSKIVLFLSKLDFLKGVEELLDGFVNYLGKDAQNAYLVLAGPDIGNMVARLTKKIEKHSLKNVVFTGTVDGNLKTALIQQSNVVCLLSYTESLPQVILEATSYKKPVIFTKECNVDSLFLSGGGLLTTRKPNGVSKCLEKILSDRKYQKETGERAYDWYLREHNPRKSLLAYKDLYEEATK